VKEGQQVAKGQIVAAIENTDVLSLQREYFTTYQECESADIMVALKPQSGFQPPSYGVSNM
jgi:hypothetical protein